MPQLDELRTIALPYWARPGFMLATDDESGGGNDDEDDDLDEDDDEGDGDDPDAEKTDEELRSELKEIRKRLESSNDKGKRNRLKARELQKQLDERGREKAKPKSDDDEDKPDPAEIRRQALADARNESDSRIKKGAVRAELRAAGIATEQLARVAGMVNLDDLDVDDNGEVDGIDEAVSDLKAEFPQLFGIEAGKRRRPGVTGPSDEQRGGSKRKLSVDQQLANQLLGKR